MLVSADKNVAIIIVVVNKDIWFSSAYSLVHCLTDTDRQTNRETQRQTQTDRQCQLQTMIHMMYYIHVTTSPEVFSSYFGFWLFSVFIRWPIRRQVNNFHNFTVSSNIDRFSNSFTDTFNGTLATERSLKIPPRLKRVDTLPCKYQHSNAGNSISQRSAATRLRCGGNFSDQFIANLMLSASVKEF